MVTVVATPDPDGQQIYFTATGQAGSGVFGVPFAGGATRAVAVGDPFVAPRGLAISTDGQQLYVADPEAAGADGRTGRIFVVPAAGGAPAAQLQPRPRPQRVNERRKDQTVA